MALTIGDNFSFRARKPLDARILVTSIANLLAIPNSTIYDGIIVYVANDKKFYTYDSNNTIDPTLQQWRELKTASYTIKTATIDSVSTSPTYNHLILTLDDDPTNPTKIDCGNAKGDKGDKGDGFAITKLYTSIHDMINDASPVADGKMVAVVYTDTASNKLVAKVYIRNTTQTQDASGNENGYTYFCNIADATTIQGPKGDDGSRGYTPIVTTSAVAATSTTPAGVKLTFIYGPGTYNEKIGAMSAGGTFNASFTNINPSSLIINDGPDSYTSDASGNINDSTGNTVGTINYATGLITSTTLVLNDGRISYTYKNTTDCTIYNGLNIKSANIRSNDGHLILTLTDNSTIDVGALSSSSGGGIMILGCFSSAPTTFNSGDIYFNTSDNKLYTATSSTAWGTGETPEENMIYISIADKSLYAYDTTNGFRSYGGSGGTAQVSTKSDNALKNVTGSATPSEDGLYVEDLKPILNKINVYQNTVNQELDYCFIGFWNNSNSEVHVSVARGGAIPFNTKFEGNLDFNASNKAIKLKAGHRYKLHYQCKQTGVTNHMERFYNETTSEWLKMACNCDTEDETHTMEEIYAPTVDCEVSVRNCWCPTTSFNMRVNTINTNSDGIGLRTIDCESAFIVTEVGKALTVDPVAYLSKNGNLEETPVGSIISYMGNNVPKHYLACDGTVYNISDYPELALHIKTEFGAYNYFGGDDITTFAVPNLSGEFLRGTGTNSHTNQGSGSNVGIHQDEGLPNITGSVTDIEASSADGAFSRSSVGNIYVGVGGGASPFGVLNFSASKSNSIYGSSNHVTPTNTSVLYCIKYETTHKVFFGDQTTYKVSVPFTRASGNSSQAIVFDNTNAEDDISMLGANKFIIPMDGYYAISYFTEQFAGNPGNTDFRIYVDDKVISSDTAQKNTSTGLSIVNSIIAKLKKEQVVTVNFWTQNSAPAINGVITLALVNTLNENKVVELMNKPNTWVVGQEYDFGDGVYGVKLTLTNNSSTDSIIDLSKYNVSEIEKIEGKAVVDNGYAQALIPCFYSTSAYLSCWFEIPSKLLHLSRGTQYSQSTDRFEINIWYKK